MFYVCTVLYRLGPPSHCGVMLLKYGRSASSTPANPATCYCLPAREHKNCEPNENHSFQRLLNESVKFCESWALLPMWQVNRSGRDLRSKKNERKRSRTEVMTTKWGNNKPGFTDPYVIGHHLTNTYQCQWQCRDKYCCQRAWLCLWTCAVVGVGGLDCLLLLRLMCSATCTSISTLVGGSSR